MGTERTDDDDYEYDDDDDDDNDDDDDDDYDDDDDNVGGGGNGWGVDDDDNDDDFDNLQWGTKVLRHFRKMAPFCIMAYLSPSPVYPNPFPPKSMMYFGPSSLSVTLDNIDSGSEGIYGV